MCLGFSQTHLELLMCYAETKAQRIPRLPYIHLLGRCNRLNHNEVQRDSKHCKHQYQIACIFYLIWRIHLALWGGFALLCFPMQAIAFMKPTQLYGSNYLISCVCVCVFRHLFWICTLELCQWGKSSSISTGEHIKSASPHRYIKNPAFCSAGL